MKPCRYDTGKNGQCWYSQSENLYCFYDARQRWTESYFLRTTIIYLNQDLNLKKRKTLPKI